MPKTLRSGERLMVLNVKDFCEREKRNEAPLIPFSCVLARVAALTGISEETVSTIIKEGQVAASTSTQVSKPRKSGPRLRIVLDDFERCSIRHKIHEFNSLKEELPNLNRMLDEIRSEIEFKGSRTALWNSIKEMGFVLKKNTSKGKVFKIIIEAEENSDTSDVEDSSEDEDDQNIWGPLNDHNDLIYKANVNLLDHAYSKR